MVKAWKIFCKLPFSTMLKDNIIISYCCGEVLQHEMNKVLFNKAL